MRLGLGLHLWAQEHYFLDASLARQQAQVHELKDSLAPRSQVETLLREHGRTWAELRDIMRELYPARADDITVESLKATTEARQVQVIREALAAHAAGVPA